MPESPDFDQIARQLFALVDNITDEDPNMEHRIDGALTVIAEHLRHVWNARGAADAQAVESRIRELVAGEVVGAGIARHIADAIQQVDR
jgi:hypothetical protein